MQFAEYRKGLQSLLRPELFACVEELLSSLPLEPTQTGPSEDGNVFGFTWDNASHRLDIELELEPGATLCATLVYRNRLSGDVQGLDSDLAGIIKAALPLVALFQDGGHATQGRGHGHHIRGSPWNLSRVRN